MCEYVRRKRGGSQIERETERTSPGRCGKGKRWRKRERERERERKDGRTRGGGGGGRREKERTSPSSLRVDSNAGDISTNQITPWAPPFIIILLVFPLLHPHWMTFSGPFRRAKRYLCPGKDDSMLPRPVPAWLLSRYPPGALLVLPFTLPKEFSASLALFRNISAIMSPVEISIRRTKQKKCILSYKRSG